MATGHCKHGEFDLLAGCKLCIAERFHLEEQTQETVRRHELSYSHQPTLVKVRYYSAQTGAISPREYTYYTAEPLKVGDIVTVPVRDTTGKAQVSAIDVPEMEVAAFKDKVKTIPAGSKQSMPVDVPSKVNLCDTCSNRSQYPECESDVQCGNGLGNDNIIKCGNYQGSLAEAVKVAAKAEGVEQIKKKENWKMSKDLILVDPYTDIEVIRFVAEGNQMRDFAEARAILTAEDMKLASADLILIRKLKKAMESRRKDYLEPFQAHVKEVNEAYKVLMAPVEAADKLTGDKMLAYTAEQTRIRQEQERINAERMKLAQDEMKLTGELTESVNLVEVLPPVSTTTKTDLGSTGLRDHWVFEVENFALLPDEYKIADAVKIGKVVRAGLHSIPGVKIENKPYLATGK
jgi:hypothetical protein